MYRGIILQAVQGEGRVTYPAPTTLRPVVWTSARHIARTHPHLVTGLLEAATLEAMLSARDWLPGKAFHITLNACGSTAAIVAATVR